MYEKTYVQTEFLGNLIQIESHPDMVIKHLRKVQDHILRKVISTHTHEHHTGGHVVSRQSIYIMLVSHASLEFEHYVCFFSLRSCSKYIYLKRGKSCLTRHCACSSQFVLLIMRLQSGKVIMVPIDICKNSPITVKCIYGIT